MMREYNTGDMHYLSFDSKEEMETKLKDIKEKTNKSKKIISGPINTIE